MFSFAQIFFTLNGSFVGVALSGVENHFYPCVALDDDVCVRVNFGQEPFRYWLLCLFLFPDSYFVFPDVHALKPMMVRKNDALCMQFPSGRAFAQDKGKCSICALLAARDWHHSTLRHRLLPNQLGDRSVL